MKELTSRERVLKNIRTALLHKSQASYANVDYETNVYKPISDLPELYFAEQFTEQGGKFVFCENADEAKASIEFLIADCGWKTVTSSATIYTATSTSAQADVSIIDAEVLVARTGSVMVASNSLATLHASNIIIVGYTHQLITELADAMAKYKDTQTIPASNQLCIITGSANAKKEVYLLLIDA
jgi:L-lactate dehydrogenase complex protein LldG